MAQLPDILQDDQEAVDAATGLTAKQERFARIWANTDNQSTAYRGTYMTSAKTLSNTVWRNASIIATLPAVRARYNQLREQAANETLMSIREAFQWQVDIATADASELVRVVVDNCRHCHGIDYGYQWRDENELFEAQQEARTRKQPEPESSGGFGFVGNLEPNAACPHCYGRGVERVVIADTSTLSGKAKKLYAGAKQDKKTGKIEIQMHDQAAAWDKVIRMMGAYNDKLDIRTPEQRRAEAAQRVLPDDVTAEDASKAYISLLG